MVDESEYGGSDGVIQARRSPAFRGVGGQGRGYLPEGAVVPAGSNTGAPDLGELGHGLTAAEEALVLRRTGKMEANGVGRDAGGRGLADDFVPYTETEAEADLRGETTRKNRARQAGDEL